MNLDRICVVGFILILASVIKSNRGRGEYNAFRVGTVVRPPGENARATALMGHILEDKI